MSTDEPMTKNGQPSSTTQAAIPPLSESAERAVEFLVNATPEQMAKIIGRPYMGPRELLRSSPDVDGKADSPAAQPVIGPEPS